MAKPYLSVIIPAYNEAARLPMTLIDIDKHLSNNDFSYEIIVVNDGSTDATGEIIKRFSLLIYNLKLVDVVHQGRGEAMRQGALVAKGNWRLFIDADNSISIVEFNKMIPYFSPRGGYEIVIASRLIRDSRVKIRQPFFRYSLTKIGNWLSRFLLIRSIHDPQCGFKCYSEAVTKKIFPLAKTKNWAFDIEVLALAQKLGYKIKELPIFWIYGFRSKRKINDYFSFLKEVFKIRYWLSRNYYKLES
jgi:glycosyltransferase involved in cell wall biosynthesis